MKAMFISFVKTKNADQEIFSIQYQISFSIILKETAQKGDYRTLFWKIQLFANDIIAAIEYTQTNT